MRSLSSRLQHHALDEPGRRAIAEGERRIDYSSLWAQACAFAQSLESSGVSRGDRVAVILSNCIEAVVACYGCWLAEAVVVPLNAQARPRDLEPWLRHCEARCVVHAHDHADAQAACTAIGPDLIRILVGGHATGHGALSWEQAIAQSATANAPEGNDHALAMILYTSGTTGAPKGVMLSHANLAANVDSIIGYLELNKDDSIVTVLPFYYSYGQSVLHTHLASGAYLVIEQNLVFPHLMVETLAREKVSGFSGVPSTFLLLLNRVPLADYDLSSLRYL
ncbi:MAG: acyl--CoA ligase, partial [Rhodanobacteraceae bacterium]|nr:acyl--CoA ligase [Rhodanobacteraceae bacterium]